MSDLGHDNEWSSSRLFVIEDKTKTPFLKLLFVNHTLIKKRKKASHVYKFFSCPHDAHFNIFLNTLFAIKNITNQHEGTWECCMEEKPYRTLFWASKVCKRGLLLWNFKVEHWQQMDRKITSRRQMDAWLYCVLFHSSQTSNI